MLRLGTRPDNRGLWLFIEAPERLEYAGQCIAIGAGGHRTSISFHGTTTGGGTWRLIETPFPVIQGALTDFELRLPSMLSGREPARQMLGRTLFPTSYSAPFGKREEDDDGYPEGGAYPESIHYPSTFDILYPHGELQPEPPHRAPRKHSPKAGSRKANTAPKPRSPKPRRGPKGNAKKRAKRQ